MLALPDSFYQFLEKEMPKLKKRGTKHPSYTIAESTLRISNTRRNMVDISLSHSFRVDACRVTKPTYTEIMKEIKRLLKLQFIIDRKRANDPQTNG